MKKFSKRLGAILVSAAMLTGMTAVASSPMATSITADAAGDTVTVGKTFEIPLTNGKGDVTNKDEVTYSADVKSLATSGIKTLQFNLSAETSVAQFVYFMGISLDKDPWWANVADGVTCTPYSDKFSIVVDLSKLNIGYDDTYGEKHFEFQNCYTQDIKGQPIKITLDSITVNGTTDTSNGTKPETGAENTGGAGYKTGNTPSGNYTFTDNGDGTATITSTLTKKIDDIKSFYADKYGNAPVTLTPSPAGEDYSEDGYSTIDPVTGGVIKKSEEEIRNEGLPLNSHKFSYSDFGIFNNTSETAEITIESLNVALRAPKGTNVTRVMYGGGLNVEGHSAADTEWTKNQAGLKADKNAGYWYNDLGEEAYEETMDAIKAYNSANGTNIEFGVTVGGGQNLTEQNFGDYVSVTWDVPKEVIPYTTSADTDTISFQLWYGEIEADTYTPLESLELESAALTYTQSITFPYKNKTTKSYNTKLSSTGTEFKYADFGVDYDVTCDVYAILFTVQSASPVDTMVLGAGTSVRENCTGATSEYWFQADACPSEEQGRAISLVSADESKKEYTFMWEMPGRVARGLVKDKSGKYVGNGTNYVSTEQPLDNFKLSLYYAGKEGKETSDVTVKDVTIYYTTDDKNNAAKSDMFEDDLYVRPGKLVMEVGDEETLESSVEGCTFITGDVDVVTVDDNGNVVAVGAGETVITVKSPQGQVTEVSVVVNAAQTTTTTTAYDPKLNALYGDCNLDKKVTLVDLVYLNKYNTGALKFNAQQMENANVVYDDDVNAADGSLLLMFMVEKVDKLGPGAVMPS